MTFDLIVFVVCSPLIDFLNRTKKRAILSVVVLVVLTGCVCTSLYWAFLFLPAITTVIMSLFLERIFKKYAPEDADDAQPEEDPLEEVSE